VELSLNATLNNELRQFSRQHSLSDREQEVLFLLTQGYTSSESISHTLEISPNTTNNHVKSILDKTGTSSKTELLTAFLKNLLLHYTSFKLLAKKPRVLLVTSDQKLQDFMTKKLSALGVVIFTDVTDSQFNQAANADLSIERYRNRFQSIDFVIADSSLKIVTSGQVGAWVSSFSPERPVLFVLTSDTDEQPVSPYQWGATASFPKNSDINLIYFRMLEHYLESPYDHSRLVRAAVDLTAATRDGRRLKMSNLSFDGAFIAIDKDSLWKGLKIEVGNELDFSFQLDDQSQPISVAAQVVWKRTKSRADKPAGFGLRFVRIAASDKEIVQSYVRHSKIGHLLPLPFQQVP
jgi:DNA-binding NarL/FixJ family response regulator/Tfp pilus assembly protein PilZ